MIRFKSEEILIESGSPCNTIYLIEEGTVLISYSNKTYRLAKGDIVGVADIALESHLFSYSAKGNVSAVPFPFDGLDGLLSLMDKNPLLCKAMMNSVTTTMCLMMDSYHQSLESCKELCSHVLTVADFYQGTCKDLGYTPKMLPFSEELATMRVKNEIDFWMDEFYKNIRNIINQSGVELSSNFVYGFIAKCGDDIVKILELEDKLSSMGETFASYLVNEDYIDYYEMYANLYFKATADGHDAGFVKDIMDKIMDNLKKSPFADKGLVVRRVVASKAKFLNSGISETEKKDSSAITVELANSLNTILEYADCLDVTASEFKRCIDSYKSQVDKIASDKEMDDTRRSLVKIFYVVYTEVALKAVIDEKVPTIIKMFLNFGYVDSTLCGPENAEELYHLCESFHGNSEAGIYTMLEWMKAVYSGEKMPSRNEFEQDYQAYVRSLIKEDKILKDQENDMLEDPKGKLVYELENMFPTVNKITFGRILSFCPILLEENLYKSIKSMLMSAGVVDEVLCKLNKIDYSVFYHECVYEDTKINVKEYVHYDIRPDIILMPNVGSRGILWQEIEGMKRTTPGRMMISVLHQESPEKTFIRMFGEFRWEMCKREQGARWNDVSTHSLTAEYCDYVQFYAKNRDLTFEAKEKLKENLKKNKNNFKEMFLFDYNLYISFESTASCRLNKVARNILFEYCPLGAQCREVVAGNTMFADCLKKHHIHTATALHKLDQIEHKFNAAGRSLPDELAAERELLAR